MASSEAPDARSKRPASKDFLSSLQKGFRKLFNSSKGPRQAKGKAHTGKEHDVAQAKDAIGGKTAQGSVLVAKDLLSEVHDVLVDTNGSPSASKAGSAIRPQVLSKPAVWPQFRKSQDLGPAAAPSLVLSPSQSTAPPLRRPSAQPNDIVEPCLVAEPHTDKGLEVRALVSRCRVPARDLSLGTVPVVSARSLHAALSATDLPVVVARVAMGGTGIEYAQRVKHTSKELPPVCAAAQKLASAKQVHRERGAAAATHSSRRRPPRRALTSVNLKDKRGAADRCMSSVLQDLRQLAEREKKGSAVEHPPVMHTPMLQRSARRASAGAGTPAVTMWGGSFGGEDVSSTSLFFHSGIAAQPASPEMRTLGSGNNESKDKTDLVELFCMLAKTTRHLRVNAGSMTGEQPDTLRASLSGGPHSLSGNSGLLADGLGEVDNMSQDLELLQHLLRARSGLSSGPVPSTANIKRRSTSMLVGVGSNADSTPASGSLHAAKVRRGSLASPMPQSFDAPAPLSAKGHHASSVHGGTRHAVATSSAAPEAPLLGGAPVSVVSRAMDAVAGGMSKAYSSPNLRAMGATAGVSLRVRPKLRNDPDAPAVGGMTVSAFDDTCSSSTTLLQGTLPPGSVLSNGLSNPLSTGFSNLTGYSGGVSSTLSGASGLERAGGQSALLRGYSSNMTGALPTVLEAAHTSGVAEGHDEALSADHATLRLHSAVGTEAGTEHDHGPATSDYAPSTGAPSTRTSRPRPLSSPGIGAVQGGPLRRAKTALGIITDRSTPTSMTPRASFDDTRTTPLLLGGAPLSGILRSRTGGDGFAGAGAERPCAAEEHESPQDEEPQGAGGAQEGEGVGVAVDHQGRLEPVYVNEAASVLFGIASMFEAQALLDIQMGRNPSLMLVLEEMVTQLLAGQSQVLTHYVPCYPASVLAPARAAAKAGRAPPLRPHSFARRTANQPQPTTSPGSFLQVQVMAVRLALSDYQCEAALFIHYRSIKGPAPGVPGSLRPSVDLTAAMQSVRGSGRYSSVPVVHEEGEPSLSPSPCRTPGHSSTHDSVLCGGHGRTSVMSLAAWTPGRPPNVPSTGGAPSSGAAGVGLWVSAAATAGPPPCPPPLQDRPSFSRSSVTQAIGPIASDNSIFMAMQAQLQLMYAALAHAPCIMTVLSMDGRVLFQNGRSVDYCGLVYNCTSQIGRPLSHPLHTLRRLFALDPSALDNLLGAVNGGQLWSGLVRMPACVDLAADYEGQGQGALAEDDSATVALAKTFSGRCAVQVVRCNTKKHATNDRGVAEDEADWAHGLLGDIDELAESLSASPAAALISALSTGGSGGLPDTSKVIRAQGISPQLTKAGTCSSDMSVCVTPLVGDSGALPTRQGGESTSLRQRVLSRDISRDLQRETAPARQPSGSAVAGGAMPAAGLGSEAAAPRRSGAELSGADGSMPVLRDWGVYSEPATMANGQPALHVTRAMLSSFAEPEALTDALEALQENSSSTIASLGRQTPNAGAANGGSPTAALLSRRTAGMPPVSASAYTAHLLNSGANAGPMQMRQLAAAQEDQVCTGAAPGQATPAHSDSGRVCPSMNGGALPLSDPSNMSSASGPQAPPQGGKGAEVAGSWIARRGQSMSQQVAVSRLLSGGTSGSPSPSFDRGTSSGLMGMGSGLTAFEAARMSVDLGRTGTGVSRDGYATRPSLDMGGMYSSLSGTSAKVPSSGGTPGSLGFGRRSRILVAQARPIHRSDAFVEQEQELTGTQRALKLLQGARTSGTQGASPGLPTTPSFARTNSGVPLADCGGVQAADPSSVAVTSSLYALTATAGLNGSGRMHSSRGQSGEHPTLATLALHPSLGAAEPGGGHSSPEPTANGVSPGMDAWGRGSNSSNSRLTGGGAAGAVNGMLSTHTSSNRTRLSPQDITAAYASNDSATNDMMQQAAHSAPLHPLNASTHLVGDPLAAGRTSGGQELSGGVPPVLGDIGSYQWHDIEAHRVPNAMTGSDMLVLVHYDVTHYVNAELEVKRVLDVEHKLLEEIFPRHVLQVMAASTTSTTLYRQHSAASEMPLAAQRTSNEPGLHHCSGLYHASSRVDLSRMESDVPGSPSMQRGPASLSAMRSGMLPPQHASSGLGTTENTATIATVAASSGLLVMEGADTADVGNSQWVEELSQVPGTHAAHAGPAQHLSNSMAPLSRVQSPAQLPSAQTSFGHRASSSGAGAVTSPSRQGTETGGLTASPSCRMLPSLAPMSARNFGSPRQGGALGGVPAHHGPSASDLQGHLARHHEQVTVLFADIKSFTSMCNEVPPHVVMSFLNSLFTAFDELVEAHGVYKVETIGDCYMVAGGLLARDSDGFYSVATHLDPDHARKVFAFAVDMLRVARTMPMPGSGGATVELRVGIHSGPCMSGVVGRKMPRFCLFGDTVNTASRMESTGAPGAIHVSEETWVALGGSEDHLAADPYWKATGGVEAKGKGRLSTYIWRET